MSMIQDILQQLGDWQMNTESYGDIANISQSDIAAAMTSGFGAAGEFMNPQMFQTIGTGVLEGGGAERWKNTFLGGSAQDFETKTKTV